MNVSFRYLAQGGRYEYLLEGAAEEGSERAGEREAEAGGLSGM